MMPLAQRLNLSLFQLRMISQTWPHIYHRGETALGGVIVNSLCTNATTRTVLEQTAVPASAYQCANTGRMRCNHAKFILDMMNLTVTSLDRPTHVIGAIFTQIGQRHAHLFAVGLRSNAWDDLCE